MAQSKKAPMMLRLMLYFIILLVLTFLGGWWYWNHLKSPVNPDGKSEAFVVQKGESISQIADNLKGKGLIRSDLAFKIILKLSGQATHVEPGDFKLSPSMSTEEIIVALRKGAVDKWVTLLEGWRVEQIAMQLHNDLGINSHDFIKEAASSEGHLFPDTYLMNPSSSPQTIVSILTNTFDQRYNDDLQTKVKAKGLTTEQGVILASIVEREARSDEVRTKVASILLKRLKIGMALNADATVQYAKDTQTLKQSGKLDKFWQPVSQDDYSFQSPFNTYLNAGLPPTPICNPSVSSLTAVANADSSTPYLFYYHDSQGNSYYARTLEEHNANVAKHP